MRVDQSAIKCHRCQPGPAQCVRVSLVVWQARMGLTKKGKILLTSLATLLALASIAAFAVSVGNFGPKFRKLQSYKVFFPFREEASARTPEGEVRRGETGGHQGLPQPGQDQDGGPGGDQRVGEDQERRGHFNVEYPLSTSSSLVDILPRNPYNALKIRDKILPETPKNRQNMTLFPYSAWNS